jgi:multiple sugar transport system permease protein
MAQGGTWYRLSDLLSRWSFMVPTIVLLTLVLAYPLFYAVQISFSKFDLMTFGAGKWVGLDNYIKVLSDYRFWDSLRVTVVYLVFALPVQVGLGFGIAYLINAPWLGRSLIRAVFIIPLVVAPVIAGGVWRMILDPLWGLMNFWLGLVGVAPLDWFGDSNLAMVTVIIIDVWRWTPFVVLIATAALLALPKDVFEAAKIDGANWWDMLWMVALPLLVPVLAATFIVRWLGAVKMFDIVLAATMGGPGKATDIVNLFIYQEAFQSLHFSESTAMAMVVLVLTMVITGLLLAISRKLENVN